MPGINSNPDADSDFDYALKAFIPKPQNREAARYEAHQELHNLPSPALQRIVKEYESRAGFEQLAFSWNVASEVAQEQKCLTDMPDIRYDVARAIFKARSDEGKSR